MILRSPLPRIHYYKKKQLQVKESQYSQESNWTYSVVTISLFQCTAPNTWLTNCADPSTRLNHQFEKDVGCKVFLFIICWRLWSVSVTKPYGVQIQQFLQELRQTRFPVTLFFTFVKFALVQLVLLFMATKIILIYV